MSRVRSQCHLSESTLGGKEGSIVEQLDRPYGQEQIADSDDEAKFQESLYLREVVSRPFSAETL